MSGFSVTPIGSGVPASPQNVPRYIQFQYNGIDLGGPDADTLNFVGELVAFRGVSGADETTVTVMLVE